MEKNYIDYFDLEGIKLYKEVVQQTYDASNPAASWHKDMVSKLGYLIGLLQSFGESLYTNYKQRPNAQAGRGKIIFRDYLLIGFAPIGMFKQGEVFIKLMFCYLSTKPKFTIEIDVNEKLQGNPYLPFRDKLNSTSWSVPVNENFPRSWESLLQLTKPEVLKKIHELKSIVNLISNSSIEDKQKDDNNILLNTILYGPPGTGKTYATLEKAVQCAEPVFQPEGDTVKEKRDSYRKKYEELIKEGRIQFITFHQSFSYEDFIEGIKPVPPKPGSDDAMSYQVKDGILKRLAKLAMEKKSAANFEEAYQQFVADVSEAGTIPLKTPVHKKDFIVKINTKGSSVAIPQTEKATEMTLTQDFIKDYIIHGTTRDWKPYTTAIGNYIKDKYNIQVETTDNTRKNFVLIIDEINRGNVSQIFGELITLIEEDKRAGKEEMLEVRLPYSGEAFSVPPNLYLIGTMNTADRSVEALDTALRRRFSFIEMQPEETHELIAQDVKIDNRQFNFSEILKRINTRMEVLAGRDHKIGHSYFLQKPGWTWKDYLHIFTHKIIPLLQEYFYGDYSRICLVLGEGFVQLTSDGSTNNDLFAKLPPKMSRAEDQLSSLQGKEIWELVDWKKPEKDEVAFAGALNTLLMNVKQQNGENE